MLNQQQRTTKSFNLTNMIFDAKKHYEGNCENERRYEM